MFYLGVNKLHCSRLPFGVALLLGFGLTVTNAQTGLEYQNRGNRFEGLRQPQVSGYDIELISALVDYEEKFLKFPDTLKVRFYLEKPAKTYLTVRELDADYHYVLDKVTPSSGWRSGFNNEFAWPSAVVLKQLKDLDGMYTLGVVARVNNEDPRSNEVIAPVVFYHTLLPDTIKGYMFTFKTSGSARVVCQILREGENKVLLSQNFLKVKGGEPYSVHWECSDQTSGWYKLVVNGYFQGTDEHFSKLIRFYHQKSVR